jgi:hypothetical protein
MRSRWPLIFAGAVALALVGLLATMTTDKRGLAFTLGVQPQQVAAVLKTEQEVCQRPIDVSADAASVEFEAGTFGRPGPPLRTTVRTDGESWSAVLPGGYPDNSRQRVRVGGIEEGNRISVCLRNLGKHPAALYGSGAGAARTSAAFLDGQELPGALMLVFHRSPSRSMFSLLPTVFERAALFHPGWTETWLFWFLAALLVTAVPVALALSLASAAGRD